MNCKIKLLLITFCFFTTIFCAQSEPPSIKEIQCSKNYKIRVLLQENKKSDKSQWIINSSSGFVFVDPEQKSKKKISEQELIISFKNGKFFINNHALTHKKFYLYAYEGYLKLNQKEYEGSFLITQDEAAIYLINSIALEEYVCSVLRTESWPGWPLEVNKAFAIASRSYVIGVILANKKSTLPYHVKNTNKHQTYSGVHTNQILKEAVYQTRGIFLAYDSKPIVAMFDACCGGVIPAHIYGVNFAQAPYLARTYACNFCKECKGYNWYITYPVEQFEQLLMREYKQFKKLHHIKVSKTDKAGLVQQIHIKGHNKLFSMTGKKLYSMLAKVRSFCFDISLTAREVIFNGWGIGHHMGLCQWGAREMVRQGYTHKSILSFYYPNTTFMKLA